MSERRYNDEEVAAILQRAAEAQQSVHPALPSSEGMTLANLQEIAREVGIAPEAVAQAARSIALQGRPTTRRVLGLPMGVGLTVDLDRPLSDAEWERLVVDLRQTFDARGSLRQEGNFRQWTNGNLQALLEPIETGHRVRLRTFKGSARSMMLAGSGMVTIGWASIALDAVRGTLEAGEVSGLGLVMAVGAGLIGAAAARLPGWARLRRRQMEEVVQRLTASSR